MITQMEAELLNSADLVVEILTSYMEFADLMEQATDSIEKADTQTARSVMSEMTRFSINTAKLHWQPVLNRIKEKRDRIYKDLGIYKESINEKPTSTIQ